MVYEMHTSCSLEINTILFKYILFLKICWKLNPLEIIILASCVPIQQCKAIILQLKTKNLEFNY